MYANIRKEILTNNLCANVEGGGKDSCKVRTLTKELKKATVMSSLVRQTEGLADVLNKS